MTSECLACARKYGPALLCLSLRLELIKTELNTTELKCEQTGFIYQAVRFGVLMRIYIRSVRQGTAAIVSGGQLSSADVPPD